MKILDLKKELKRYYIPSTKIVEVIDVPRFHYLMIDGAIEPGMAPGTSPGFQENTEAMYGAAYTLKFMMKQRKTDPVDYPVMALEGLWDVIDGKFDINIKDNWVYTLMILVPDLINQDLFNEALAQLRKKRGDLPAFERLRLGILRGRTVRADDAHRSLRHRTGDPRKDASIYAGEWLS